MIISFNGSLTQRCLEEELLAIPAEDIPHAARHVQGQGLAEQQEDPGNTQNSSDVSSQQHNININKSIRTTHKTLSRSTIKNNFFLSFLKAYYYSPVNCTGSPQGFSQVKISHKFTIENMHITLNVKHTNITES